MVHERVSEEYIHFAFMCIIDHIFLLLPIKSLIKLYGKPVTPFKLETGMKPLVSHLRVLFCLFVVRKYTAHVGTKSLNISQQAQNYFQGIFVRITQHKKGYLVYIIVTRKIISSYEVFFMRVCLVLWYIRHNHMQKRWVCVRMCPTHLMLNLQGKNW